MIAVVIALAIFALVLFSIPAGDKCPQCEKYYTSNYNALAKRIDTEKSVQIKFSHCHFCHNKWNITEDGDRKSVV